MIDATTVHTTGVNIQGVLATAGSVTVLLSPIAYFLNRSFKQGIQEAIEQTIDSRVMPVINTMKKEQDRHSVDIARMQGIIEGRNQTLATLEASSRQVQPPS